MGAVAKNCNILVTAGFGELASRDAVHLSREDCQNGLCFLNWYSPDIKSQMLQLVSDYLRQIDLAGAASQLRFLTSMVKLTARISSLNGFLFLVHDHSEHGIENIYNCSLTIKFGPFFLPPAEYRVFEVNK